MEISFGSITSGQLDWSQDSVSNEEAPSWSEIRCSAFEGRKLHTSVVVKDCIVIIGGANIQDRPLEDIIIFDIKNLEWISYDIPMVSLHARKGHTACVYGDNKIVVFGGKNDRLLRDTLMITIEEKSSDEARFSIKCEELETQNSEDLYKIFHTANIYQNQMYVFGGWNEFRESTNELWKLDLNGLAWSLCPSTGNKPGEREGHCSILYNHRLFIFGGYSTQDRSRKNDLFVLDLVSFDWQKVKTTYLWPDLRSSSCAQEKDGEIYFFGGYVEHGYSNDMFKYNIENNTWIQLDNKTSKITPRADHTFVQYEDNFFVIGGWNGIKCLSEMHCLHLNNQGRNSYKETERREKAKLLLNKRYSDVCFKVQDQEFPCHRCILAIKCNFFANMFESEMRESQASCIEINDVNPEVFKSLLEFIYTDKINLSEELALDLLELADKYSFEELKVICERFLSANITTSNLFMLANKAEFFSCQKLKNAVFEFGIKNLDSLQETNELEKFSKPFLLKIISKITNKK